MKNASFSTNDVKKCCEYKLDIKFRKAKEFNGWYYLGNRKAARITVSKGRKSISPKTYQTMAKQLKLNIAQFDDLLECPIDKRRYEKILRGHAS